MLEQGEMSRTVGTNRQRVGNLDEDVTRFLSGGEMDALMSDERFETLEVRHARRLGEIKQLQSENTGLRGQLKAAQQLIKNLSKRGTVSGSNKRLRLGSEPASISSALVSHGNGEDDEPAYHPAEARADRVQSELDEQKLLREQDRKKLELLLGDAESTNKKLLRQVKFLAEEEEEARAEYGKKQKEFLAEMANLQEALRAERAARATASADGDHLARQERQGLERTVQREMMARKVAEERIAVLERQAKARAAELTDARSEARDAGAEQSRLSRELAALRRDNGPTTPLGDQDTPVARELRAKIRVMERDARRMEVTVQELTDDRRNSALLEEKAQSLQAKLQRTEAALENALKNEAEHAATKEEKEQWALLFSKAIKEERLMASFTKRGGFGEAGERSREEGQDTQPTPLAALQLLRDIQAEKSVMLQELTSLRLRHKDATERLEQAQALVKEKQGGEESLNIRAENLQRELENLGRRCRTAEQEVEAQKELIESYERDNFRKPSESWLGDCGKMQAALAAAKDEALSLRQQAESSISEAEASRLRTRAEQVETKLLAVIEEKNKTERTLAKAEQEVAGYENRVATGADGGPFKVLHLTHNPERLAWEKEKADLTKQVEAFKEDNKRLVRQHLESAGAGSMDASMSSSMSMMQGGVPDAAKYSQRLKEAFKERINYYREAVYLLTGYKVDLVKDPARQVLRLRSMYAEHEADGLVFQQVDDGLELVETPFAKDHLEKVESYLGKFHSIPAFLSSITLELFEKQTFMPRPF